MADDTQNENSENLDENHDENSDFTTDNDDFSDLDELTEEHDQDFDLDETLNLDEDETTQVAEETQADTESETPSQHVEPSEEAASATTEEPAPVAPVEDRTPYSPQAINVALVVEVGRVQMSMEKLLKLEPGNLLELDFHPENGVNLVVNGKIIGKGELIRIGDAIGIRILDLGQ